jgi:signal transduction histidine kinase
LPEDERILVFRVGGYTGVGQDKSTLKSIDILHAFNVITEKIAEYDENLEELLQAIIGLPLAMLNISYASVLLLDQERNHFGATAFRGHFPFSLDLKDSIDIFRLKGCPAIFGQRFDISSLIDEPKLNHYEHLEGKHLNRVHGSPLVVRHKVAGIACIYGEEFNPGTLETELFCLWSGLASLAIEKSRLHNQLHERLQNTRLKLDQAESQLIRSEKLNSLIEIAMSLADTIRNPIMVIGGLCRRIRRNLPDEDPKRQWSEMMLMEASRLESIVTEFSRFFTIDEIALEQKDLNELVERVADEFLLQEQSGIKTILDCRIFDKPLICKIDESLLERCLLNLLANARDTSRNKVHISLLTYQLGEDAIIEVADSGNGMSKEEMRHIFDPFYTTKPQRAGMGLTFVHFVVSEHSGQVELSSEKGMGTRFRIRLPLVVNSGL